MPQGESTVLPHPRRDAPVVTEEPEEATPETERFASIIPDGEPALFKPGKGRVGMR